MPLQKSIVIGCDDANYLSTILKSIEGTTLFAHKIISAAYISDLLGIVKSLNPDLVILCFRNNQLVLNDFNFFVKKPHVPILCLSKEAECEKLRWDKSNIVFTYPVEHASKEEYLCSRIHSIFMLGPVEAKRNHPNGTLADIPVQANQRNRNENLSRYVLELDQKVEVLLKVKERIADLYPSVDDSTRVALMSIVNSIKASANDTKLWDDFKLYFESMNPDFLLLLARSHPELTPKDLKYCCYLKMNMTNDDIRNLLGINQESVRTHKYRLKKKMELSKDQDLINYLRYFDRKELQ